MGMEWEMPMGMEFMGGMGASYAAASLEDAAAASAAASSPAYHYGLPSADVALGVNDYFPSAFHSTDSHFLSSVNPLSDDRNQQSSWETNSQCNQSSFNFDIPCEEEAELAWLSQFVEDSFSDVPYQYHAMASVGHNQPQLLADESIIGRAVRSKRSTTSIPSPVCSTLALPPPPQAPSPSSSSSSSDLPPPQTGCRTVGGGGANSSRGNRGGAADAGVRRCTHCASEKTPQWRTGPLGPKTLCNACGVRYKSGRLVPEYRPAASPTFVLAQHSNSHRKVMELRRQKEALLRRRDGRLPSTAVSEELLLDDSDDVSC